MSAEFTDYPGYKANRKRTLDEAHKLIFEEFKALAKEHDIIFILPKAPPPVPNPSWVPKLDFQIIDYVSILRPVNVPAPTRERAPSHSLRIEIHAGVQHRNGTPEQHRGRLHIVR